MLITVMSRQDWALCPGNEKVLTPAVPVIDTAASPGLTWPVHVILDVTRSAIERAAFSAGSAYCGGILAMTNRDRRK